MEYFSSRYQPSNHFYPKSEFSSLSRDSPSSSSVQSTSPGAIVTKKRRKDGQDAVRAKIQQGSAALIGCNGEGDILQHVIENGIKIAYFCSVCKSIFSKNTGGYLKTHRMKCLKNIHLDKANPHDLSDAERNEFIKLIIESMTKDAQSAAYFNSDTFVSLIQYSHDLGFQYGLENAQSKGGKSFGPADISGAIPHYVELEKIVKSCVNEKKTKFYELVKHSIDGIGGSLVVDTVSPKFNGFVFHFISDEWEYICAPIAVADITTVPAKATNILLEYILDQRDITFVCNKSGCVVPFLSTYSPITSATHWMEKIFEQICENSKSDTTNISPKLQTPLNELLQLVENAKTVVKYVEKDALNSLSYKTEFDFNGRFMSKVFTVHRFMAYSDEDLEAIRSHFLLQENKPMSKIIETLHRNRIKLEIFTKMFQPFLDGIRCLEESDKTPTLHLVAGIIFNYCRKLKTEKYSNQLETVLAEIISTSIEAQIDSLFSEAHYYAMILDPKYKNNLKDYLTKEEFLQKIKNFEKLVSEVNGPSSDETKPTCSDFNPYEAMDESLNSYKTELTLYYRTNVTCDEEDYDILQWWRENALQFPRLSKLAKKYLSIPSSSNSVNKIFNLTLDEKIGSDIDALSNVILYRTIEKLGI